MQLRRGLSSCVRRSNCRACSNSAGVLRLGTNVIGIKLSIVASSDSARALIVEADIFSRFAVKLRADGAMQVF